MATDNAKKSVSFKVPKAVAASLEGMKAEGRTVKIVGRLKDGKIEFDHAGLAELGKKFPDASISFVAVNAPFKGYAVGAAD